MATQKDPNTSAVLSQQLNELGVPHSDIAIPGNTHSGRYIISQW